MTEGETKVEATTQAVAHFVIPKISDNRDGWGPTTLPDRFKDMPYAPFSKNDKVGKAADWTDWNKQGGRGQGRYQKNEPQVSNVSTVFSYSTAEDDESFRTVEGKTIKPKGFQPARRFGQGRGQRPFVQNPPGFQARRGGPQAARGGRQQPQKRWQTQTRRWAQGPYDANKRPRDFSIEVRPDWTPVETMDFPVLSKLNFNGAIEEPEDLGFYGALEFYDKSFDRLTAKSEKPLEKNDKAFYKVTTTEDPVIQQLVLADAGNVFATDAILAFLMTAPRSVYSWDLIVTRVGERLFFDKRDNSQFDYLTVNETATDHSVDENKESLNSAQSLSQEATFINQSFSQQVLRKGEKYELENSNPFQTSGEDPASVGYRYRKWRIGNDITLVARCEFDGVRVTEKGQEEFLTVKALNEYDPKLSGMDWRMKLDSQRGAILATELKNNSAKLARWSLQALLSGSQALCLGFVSRTNPKDNFQHQVLGTQFYKPKEFATQINLNTKNSWAILKHIIDTCMKLPEGKYILLKDPNKPQMTLYEVPQDAFEEPGNDDDSTAGDQ